MRIEKRMTPSVEALDARLVPGATAATAALPVTTSAPATASILQAYAAAYLSRRGGPRYNPAVDTNHNGFVGQGDARPLLRRLAPITPRQPLRLSLALGPGDQVAGPHPQNSGGVTRKVNVTIVGRTTPNSIIFTDDIFGDYSFKGPAFASDSRGFFSYTTHLGDLLTQNNYLAFDPFGHQTIRAFPVLRLAD